ncbi:hypothetical protein GCM10028790_53410 [Micromonospora taraxaci]|nr:hypothetical protein [Micromonospora taraxaci]
MRLTHSLPAVALGAAAIGAALGADPAHAHQSTPLPSPTDLRPAHAPTSPNIVEELLPRVVESPLAIALPLPSAVPLPLPSAVPLPLPSSVPRPAVPLPSTSVKPPTAIPDLPRTPRTSPSPTSRVASPAASPAARPAAPPQPSSAAATVTVTVSRGDVHSAAGGRTRSADPPPATVAAAAAPTPGPPVRPDSGPPAFVLALATAPSGFGASGVDAPTSAAERPPPISPPSRGLTVAAVDMRATSRPVERGPPPPQQLLITQPRPRR